MSLRTFIRHARRSVGLLTRTAHVQRVNGLTGLTETRKVQYRLNATGFIREEGGRIASVREQHPSKPGAGWRSEQRHDGGGKASRRRVNKSRQWGRRFEAAAVKEVMP